MMFDIGKYLGLKSKHSLKIRRMPRVVVISGAGLSAESGIQTYRGQTGRYNGLNPEDIMSGRMFARQPEIIHQYCDDRRSELASVSPHDGHFMLQRLADRYKESFIHFTQNVDDLCERAGLQNSVHLHGELRVLQSLGQPKIEVDIGYKRYWSGALAEMPAAGFRFKCPQTNTMFRPHLVLYGERAPHYRLLNFVMQGLRSEDILIVIGTHGSVLDINRFARFASGPTILNNLEDSPLIDKRLFGKYLEMPVTKAVACIEEEVDRHMRNFGSF